MIRKLIAGLIMVIGTMVSVQPVRADATLVVHGSDGLQSTIQLRNGKVKMSVSGQDEYVIYDDASETVTYVEPRQRRYTPVSREELDAGLRSATQLRQSVQPYMEMMLSGLSPAQRRLIEQRMGPAPGPPAAGRTRDGEIRTVARGRHSIAGLSCEASGIVRNGRPAAEVCMVTAPGGKLTGTDFTTLQAMVTISRELVSGAGYMLGELAGQLEFLASGIDGVPIAVRDLEKDRRYQVTSVTDAGLSDAIFSDYSRYERQEMPSLLR